MRKWYLKMEYSSLWTCTGCPPAAGGHHPGVRGPRLIARGGRVAPAPLSWELKEKREIARKGVLSAAVLGGGDRGRYDLRHTVGVADRQLELVALAGDDVAEA